MKYIKQLLLLAVFIPGLVFSQTADPKPLVDIFPYIELLMKRAKSDLSPAILDNTLNERVAITRFETSGIEIEDKYRILIIKSFEEIREPTKFFHLVGSIEALNKNVLVDSTLKNYDTKVLEDMKRYSLDLNADYYAIINVSVIDKAIIFTLVIRNSFDHSIVWGKQWSTIIREGTSSFNAGFYQGVTFGGVRFTENMFPFAFHLGLETKIFTFIDLGFYVDPTLNLLFPTGRDVNIIGFGVAMGVKVGVDMINIFNILYPNIELPIYVRAGFNIFYNTSHFYAPAQGTPVVGITARPGLALVINRNYALFFEFDPVGVGTGELAFYSGFYYRLEY